MSLVWALLSTAGIRYMDFLLKPLQRYELSQIVFVYPTIFFSSSHSAPIKGRMSDSKASMGSDSEVKFGSHQSQRQLIQCVAMALLVLMSVYKFTDAGTYLETKTKIESKKESLELSRFEGCQPNQINHSPKEWTTKPLWFPGHPDSVYPPGATKQLINGITRLPSGDKSYYAISDSQKHCLGGDETASCTLMGWDFNNKMEGKFYESYLMLLRNPQTVFPAHANAKDIAYHGGEGQLSIEDWRMLRDDWFDKMLDDWFNILALWRDSSYKIGAYVVFEHLMDPSKGPQELKKVRELFAEAGFDVAEEVSTL